MNVEAGQRCFAPYPGDRRSSGANRRHVIRRLAHGCRTAPRRDCPAIAGGQARGRAHRQCGSRPPGCTGHDGRLRFLFRNTPRNLAKLKRVADSLRATILRPYYPASNLYRVVRDDDGLQLDFMTTIHGIRSYAGLRDRATTIEIHGVGIRVASSSDIIRSIRYHQEQACGRTFARQGRARDPGGRL